MGRPLKNIRWTAALAVQAGSRLLLDINSHSDEVHNLSPSQRAAFLAISVGLVMMAGLMSGLTLGLMSMDLVELEVLKRSGTATEQMYASAITPIVSNQVCSWPDMITVVPRLPRHQSTAIVSNDDNQ